MHGRFDLCVHPKTVVLALRSTALSVMKGGGQNLKGGGGSTTVYHFGENLATDAAAAALAE